MTDLYVAWQSPLSRAWSTVGRLAKRENRFQYGYTRGALLSIRHGFSPFPAFPDLYVSYESERLFPFFANRLLPSSRPEYKDFVEWVSSHSTMVDPITLLGQSGGTRMTDSLELFPRPFPNPAGEYHIHFFVHGIDHMPHDAAFRAGTLGPGEPLLVVKDIQNSIDSRALMLRTNGTLHRDLHFVGYLPRYLAHDLAPIAERSKDLSVSVHRVNPPPAPIQFRILCCLGVTPPHPLFQGPEFEMISTGPSNGERLSHSLPPRLKT